MGKTLADAQRAADEAAYKRGHRKRPKPPSYPVESFDLETGSTVATFESAAATEMKGFRSGNVNACIHGRQRSHAGLGWRRASR